jgi:hypothetical protein
MVVDSEKREKTKNAFRENFKIEKLLLLDKDIYSDISRRKLK